MTTFSKQQCHQIMKGLPKTGVVCNFPGKLLAAPLVLAENVTTSWIKHMWVSTQEARVTSQWILWK